MNGNDEPRDQGPKLDLGKGFSDAIAEAVLFSEEKEQLQKRVPVSSVSDASQTSLIVLLSLAVIVAFLLASPPHWILPPPLTPPSSQLEEAGLRMEINLQAWRVEAFLEEEGRLPNSLLEAGDAFSEVRYRRLNRAEYRLSIDGRDKILEYSSTDSMAVFLGDALEVILPEGGE